MVMSMTTPTHTYPTCPYCHLPLTDNELDIETMSFYSAHFGCVQPDRLGTFAAADGHRYTTAKRAAEQTQRLADANHRMSFIAFNVETAQIVARATMDLAERKFRFAQYDTVTAADLARCLGSTNVTVTVIAPNGDVVSFDSTEACSNCGATDKILIEQADTTLAYCAECDADAVFVHGGYSTGYRGAFQ